MNPNRPTPPLPLRRITPPGLPLTTFTIFLGGCGLVLLIGGLLMWFNHAHPERKNDHLQPIASPDGKRQAVVFRRTSLGPEDFTTQVAILAAGGKLPNRSGKAFIAEGQPQVMVRWLDDRHLIIQEPEGTRVLHRASRVGDVSISDR